MKWLDRLRRAVSAQPSATVSVRDVLSAAMDERTRLELIPLDTPRRPFRLVTTVEEVREHDFIISHPVADGTIRQIARYEHLQIMLPTARGPVTGRTENLGRVKIEAGGGGDLFGYRLALPETLVFNDHRSDLRLLLGDDLVCEAQLQVLTRSGPIVGLVEDISSTGARVRCRNAGNHLRRDRPAHIEIELPDPIGAVRQVVRILGTELDLRTGERIVRVLFDERVDAIDEVLRGSRRRTA